MPPTNHSTCINAPEGCQRGTHKWDGLPTAYPRGTYASTQTHKHKPHGLSKGLTPRAKALTPQPRHRRNSRRRTSTRPTAGGRSPLSCSTRSCRAARGDAPPPRPPPVRRACRAPRPAPRCPTCRSRRNGPGRPHPRGAVRACAAYGVTYLKGCFRPSVISAYDTWF
jgi:hypothetical protein